MVGVMSIHRFIGMLLGHAFLLGACDQSSLLPSSTGSEAPGPTAATSDGPGAEPTPPVVGQLLGPWRRSPIVLDDGHVAIFSDACAAKARETLGDDLANLPTALVDAQGQSFAIVVLADDTDAVECEIDIDASGDGATAVSADRLSQAATAPLDGTSISVASLVRSDDGARTVALGRIGPVPAKAKLGFDDATVVQAAKENGWWATWWMGAVLPATFAATDTKDIVVGSAENPRQEIEARIGPAAWWIDPAKAAPAAKSTVVHALLREQSCASGKSAEGRVEPPTIETSAVSVIATFWVRRLPGGQDCPSNPPTATELRLPEALGDRRLLDGGTTPPRDASTAP
jgi:hypothetical protein